MQTQIRHHMRLIRVFTVCLPEFLSKIKMKKVHLHTPKIGNGLIQSIGMDGPTRKYRLNTIIFLKSLYLTKDVREVIKLSSEGKNYKNSKLTF